MLIQVMIILMSNPISFIVSVLRLSLVPLFLQLAACYFSKSWKIRILPVSLTLLVLLVNLYLVTLEVRGISTFTTRYMISGLPISDQWAFLVYGFFIPPVQLLGWWPGGKLIGFIKPMIHRVLKK